MRTFFYQLPKNIAASFWKYNLLWHLVAIIVTYFIVSTDFDWVYFTSTRATILQTIMFPAVFLGLLIPIFLPLTLYAYAAINKNARLLNTAAAIGQAAAVGLLVSWFFKALTGRAHPVRFVASISAIDTSKIFRFGFLRGGVFWGWPSSHTTVAVAMAMTIFILYPKNKLVRFLVIVYALYIGIGVSVSIHWFSDFVAGAIFGSIVGLVVGKSFWQRYWALNKAVA